MRLDRLRIVNLRNIASAELHPGPGVNWLVGNNGAGKTTVLEAIYILARGGSFRLSRVQPVIRRGCPSARVHAFGIKDNGAGYSVGVERTSQSHRVRINGESIHKISDLATGLPLLIVGPNSFHILDRGPRFRRRLVDWGVFHVEHSYKNWYSEYDRCLRQRNAALRSGSREFWAWDTELAKRGELISTWREQYVVRLVDNWRELATGISGFRAVEFEYAQGWPKETSLLESLGRSRTGDVRRGYTASGVHSADLRVLIEGRPVVEVLSRGEQKILVLLIHLAQARTIQRSGGERPVMLIDDLPSELDERWTEESLVLMRAGGWQCFVTSLSPRYVRSEGTVNDRVFHVERGEISPGKPKVPQ